MLFTTMTAVAIAVAVAVCAYHIRSAYAWYDEWYVTVAVCAFTLLVTFLVWVLACHIAAFVVPVALGANRTTEQRYDIRALAQGGAEIRGGFLLGTGSVGGEEVYSYLYELADGGYRFARVDADEATVYTDEQHDPYVTVTKHISDHWWVGSAVVLGTTVEFHVPEGTVAQDYEVAP